MQPRFRLRLYDEQKSNRALAKKDWEADTTAAFTERDTNQVGSRSIFSQQLLALLVSVTAWPRPRSSV